jgi:glyoxylase-like metal-dependent hydrolase (beta-lactamase superfamily II)
LFTISRKIILIKSIQEITPNLKLLSSHPTLAGFEDFIGTYVFHSEKKVLVDVGPKVAIPGLLAVMAEARVYPDEIDYIILTHLHMDHAGGVGQAIKEMKNARVVAHPRAFKHLVDPTVLWKASLKTIGSLALKYGNIDPVPENRIIVAEDGMKLDLGKGLVLEIYLTPGHAPHHLCVFERKESILLAGDTAGVFMDGFLRPGTPPPFRFHDYITSLDKMIALRPAKLGYAHFGCYDNAIARLQAVKAQTILWYEIAQVGAKEGKTPEEIIELIGEKDKTIDKLNALDKRIFQRDRTLILNTVRGLMTGK